MIVLSSPLDEEQKPADQPDAQQPKDGMLLSDEPTLELVLRAQAGDHSAVEALL
jgi:hypothetical protein